PRAEQVVDQRADQRAPEQRASRGSIPMTPRSWCRVHGPTSASFREAVQRVSGNPGLATGGGVTAVPVGRIDLLQCGSRRIGNGLHEPEGPSGIAGWGPWFQL